MKLEFWHRAYRHIRSMQTCNPDCLWEDIPPWYIRSVFPRITFLILDRIHPNPRGGDWNKSLLQLELRWIFTLRATHPPGLNDAVCFKPFLEGFNSGGMEIGIHHFPRFQLWGDSISLCSCNKLPSTPYGLFFSFPLSPFLLFSYVWYYISTHGLHCNYVLYISPAHRIVRPHPQMMSLITKCDRIQPSDCQ